MTIPVTLYLIWDVLDSVAQIAIACSAVSVAMTLKQARHDHN